MYSKKACGHDRIHLKLLKEGAYPYVPVIQTDL